MINMRLGSALAVVATIDPATITTVELFSDVINMSRWDQVVGIAFTADLAASTVDFKAYQCVAAGTSAVLLKANTQQASSATLNDNAQLVLSVSANELAATNTGLNYYIKFGLVFSGSGGVGGAIVLGCPNRYDTAGQNDLASVLEIKN